MCKVKKMGSHKKFLCKRCPYQGERQRVIDHIYKLHLPLESSPYYCTLCLFRCSKMKDLKRHLKGYRLHQVRAQGLRPGQTEARHLKMANFPYEVSSADMTEVEEEEGRQLVTPATKQPLKLLQLRLPGGMGCQKTRKT